jgi:hypothetical protein
MTWLTTSMLGVAVFAWTMSRPLRDGDSPLGAALSMVSLARRGGGRDVGPQTEEGSDGQPAEDQVVSDDAVLMSARASASLLTGNRPSGWQSRPSLEFDKAPAKDAVRRRITYRLVRLSDGPDDLRSQEIMRLDRGDEIEIIGQEESYLQVRTPTGAVGWIRGDTIIG